MFSRKSKLKRRAQAVADKAADGGVREQLDELGAALEDARDAIARASASAGRRVADATAEAARQASQATREAAEATREAARQASASTRRAGRRQATAARAAAERLGESDLPKKAADKLFRERAKARRKERRRQQRRTVYRGAGVAGLGVLVGWLTAPRRGREARQALRQQAAKASEKGWDKVAEGRDSGPEEHSAEVHPLHDAAGTGTQPRTPND
jgi:gas vesicle protein